MAHNSYICGSASIVCSTPLILICGMGFSCAAGGRLFLQRIEIRDDVLPIGLIGEIDEHPGAVHEANWVCEEFVEIGVVPGDVRILHRGGKIEPRNRAALAPGNTGEGWSDLILTGRRRVTHCAVGRKD